MSELSLISAAVVAAGALRQVFVLSAIVRSGQFLRQDIRPPSPAGEALAPRFFIVVPVLREAALLRETVAHFRTLACGHAATVVVVTTAREVAEAGKHGAAGDTVAVARELAREGQCAHVHYPDPLGLKGDQLNYAAACCAGILPDGVPSWRAFLVCYDADSRPPPGSLGYFAQAINDNPGADVFHQSSRFELRLAHRPRGGLRGVGMAVCGAGALRANRFVLGYEIPRLLNRSAQVSAMRRALCSGVYAHVTGHGLCVRLSLPQTLPFPARSPLEDMHYSFILGSRAVPMVAVPSLDTAEVPGTVTTQVQQAARWIFGPARFARYLKDPATRPGWRARMMALSALWSAAEWISCLIVPALVCVLIATGSPAVRITAACFAAVCLIQAVLTETWLGTTSQFGARLTRIALLPVACMVHGAGGVLGCVQLLGGGSGAGKTERGPGA
jgi:Glycosyltransferase like family 2